MPGEALEGRGRGRKEPSQPWEQRTHCCQLLTCQQNGVSRFCPVVLEPWRGHSCVPRGLLEGQAQLGLPPQPPVSPGPKALPEYTQADISQLALVPLYCGSRVEMLPCRWVNCRRPRLPRVSPAASTAPAPPPGTPGTLHTVHSQRVNGWAGRRLSGPSAYGPSGIFSSWLFAHAGPATNYFGHHPKYIIKWYLYGCWW